MAPETGTRNLLQFWIGVEKTPAGYAATKGGEGKGGQQVDHRSSHGGVCRVKIRGHDPPFSFGTVLD